MYLRKQYEAALQVLAPLLSDATLTRFLKKEAIGLSVEAAFSARLYAQAIQYLHSLSDIHSDNDSHEQIMLTILQGDLSFRQNDVAAARVCYEQAIQSDLFVPRFLGHFCCAWTYLIEEKPEQACALVKRASAEWFEHADPSDRSSALDSEPLCIGTVHIGDDSPALCRLEPVAGAPNCLTRASYFSSLLSLLSRAQP